MTPIDCLKIIKTRAEQEGKKPNNESTVLALIAVASEIRDGMRRNGYVSDAEIEFRQQLVRRYGMWSDSGPRP